ncbi:MAG: hypothetical protein ACFFCS_25415 [Candidatus Hodarchaeota archaeon]
MQLTRIEGWKKPVTFAYGACLGAMFLAIFSVVYSHQIFFSSRWDYYAQRYQETWFFFMVLFGCIPVVLSYIKQDLLKYYLLVSSVLQIIILVAWMLNFWPLYVTEASYTSIGYAFAENRGYFHWYMYISSSSFMTTMILLKSKGMQGTASTKSLISMVLFICLLGAIFCTILATLGFLGLYSIFFSMLGITVSIACTMLFSIIANARKRKSTEDSPEERNPLSSGDEITRGKDKGSLIRMVLNASILSVLILLTYLFISPKEWEAYVLLFIFIIPLVETFELIFHGISIRARKKPKGNRNYGHVVRFFISIVLAIFILVVALITAGYYRYIISYFTWFLFSTTLGIICAIGINAIIKKMGTANAKEKLPSDKYLNLRLNIMLMIGVSMFLITLTMLHDAWDGFFTYFQENTSLVPKDVYFFGTNSLVPCGLSVGFLLHTGVNSLGEYSQAARKSLNGMPRWSAVSILWASMLLPTFLFIGQFYFENRIYEWNRDLFTGNFEAILELLFIMQIVFLIIIALFIAWLVVSLINRRYRKRKSATKHGIITKGKIRAKKLNVKLLVTAAIVSVPLILPGVLFTFIPVEEPDYHALIETNADFLLWSTFPGEKISPNYKPGTFETTSQKLELILCRGETERMHLVISPKKVINSLRVNISTPLHEGTMEPFPVNGCNWYYATYNFDGQEEHLVPGNPTQYRGRQTTSAAYLAEINSWSVQAGTNQPIWLSFTSYYNSTPGIYEGNITISWTSEDSGTITPHNLTIDLDLEVLTYQKPIQYRFKTALGASTAPGPSLWRHGRMGYHASIPYMIPPPLGTVFTINWTAGDFEVNWTDFDAALNRSASEGYFHMLYTWYPGDAFNTTSSTPIPRFSDSWNTTVKKVLVNASAHLNSTMFDLPFGQGQIRAIDMISMDLYDEPGKDDAWRFRYGQILDEAAPEWKLLCTTAISREAASWPGYTGPGGVFDVVDIRVQGAHSYREYIDDPYVRDLYEEYPAELWTYWINSPWPSYPNSAQAYNPGVNVLSQVIQYYTICPVSGFLFWTAGDTAWADGGDGYTGWGSGKYFYYVTDGTDEWDPGYRFEILDEGMEIAELLRHLDALIDGTASTTLNATGMMEAEGIRDEFDQMFPDYYTYPKPHEIKKIYDLKGVMLEFLSDNT